MALQEYRRKRAFNTTPEPKGKTPVKQAGRGLKFVIQKHDASHLHYDFRLEWEGVLKSWAVPHGPSLDPEQKRLAVEVEDHPIEYGKFEGTIPQGEYGGGTVLLWDRGTWAPLGDAEEGFAEGKLKFTLEGEKLQGGWTLVRMRKREGERRNNWLLIKERDDAARGVAKYDVLEELPLSVKTGRDLDEIAGIVRVKKNPVKKTTKKQAGTAAAKRKSASGTRTAKSAEIRSTARKKVVRKKAD